MKSKLMITVKTLSSDYNNSNRQMSNKTGKHLGKKDILADRNTGILMGRVLKKALVVGG